MRKLKNWMLAPLFLVSLATGVATNLQPSSAQARPGLPGGGEDSPCYCRGCWSHGWPGSYCSPCFGSGAGCVMRRCTGPLCEIPGAQLCFEEGPAIPGCLRQRPR